MKLKIIPIIILFSLVAQSVSALGIYPTKIFFPDKLIMGKTYKNTQIRIVNTSDEAGWFRVGVANLNVPFFDKLNPEWIKLPKDFWLRSGDVEQITLKLKIPPQTKLEYWQVYGVIEVQQVNNKNIGVALGTKLTFKISKKNVPKWKLWWWSVLEKMRYFFAWVGNYMPFRIVPK